LYNKRQRSYSASKFIGSIKRIGVTVCPETLVSDVLNLYRQSKTGEFVPIVTKKGICCGIICKDKFLEKLFVSQYGLDLYGKKEISQFVSNAVLSFDENRSLEEVSKQLTAHSEITPAFIITENTKYKGVCTIMDLLSEMTKQQIKNAQHANPLTLLPGAIPINERMNELLQSKKTFSMAFFDLDNFKPFNDEYGYNTGDGAIQLVAKLLTENTNKQIDMVGHIGGDDFIVIFSDPDWENKCQSILQEFESEAISLYRKEHQDQKGINGFDRQGNEVFFPILSLSIGVVSVEATANCLTHIEISDLAAEAKHQAKLMIGNSCFVNGRVSMNK
jgi:diguanylate cyclase (GGDEF)-like protein